jgi:hypothetical protein
MIESRYGSKRERGGFSAEHLRYLETDHPWLTPRPANADFGIARTNSEQTPDKNRTFAERVK